MVESFAALKKRARIPCLSLPKMRWVSKCFAQYKTKQGNLNLSKSASENVLAAETQLRTALSTKVTLTATQERLLPSCVILCASGKINSKARDHIVGEISDPRLRFMDLDDLIPHIDESYPELWLGIEANKLPYLRALKDTLTETESSYTMADIIPNGTHCSVVADEGFAPLHLVRMVLKTKKFRGQVSLGSHISNRYPCLGC